MKYDGYPSVVVADDLSAFEFVSKGRRGDIRKRIVFTPTSLNDVYMLAFGRITEDNELDVLSVTDNEDRNKILATVAGVVNTYTRKYPARWIFFTGSSKERTRLYRMVIGINVEDFLLHFEIYAVTPGEKIVLFRKDMEIKAFLIKARI